MIGSHCVRTWSKSQATIALSSAEAELIALVKATCEGIGIGSLMQDLNLVYKLQVYADASAALGVIGRRGIGKIRHLDTSMLWIQQKELQKSVDFLKVDGVINPADLMTKHLGAPTAKTHVDTLGITELRGRAEKAANLR